MHPYFWDPSQRLEFLLYASDCFEALRDNPLDPHLAMLEINAENIIESDWSMQLDEIFLQNLRMGKFRKYDTRLVQDLLRVVRNKVCVQAQLMSSPLSLFLPFFDKSWV